MSKSTKRKYVTKEVMDDFVLPSEKDGQTIVKVSRGRGNNLHEVETARGEKFLVSMPTKFRKNVWIKRGDFVMVQPIIEGGKVKAEIINILYADQIKYIKSQGKWPEEFSLDETNEEDKVDDHGESDDSSSSSQDDDALFVNTNRPPCVYDESSSETSNDGEDNSEPANVLK